MAGHSCAAALLAVIAIASLAPARAAETCGPAPGDTTARIATIADNADIRLDDGRMLRLAGLDLAAAAARRGLATWAGPDPVTVHLLSATPDRWGRLPALLFRAGAPEPAAATALLGAGLAKAKPEPVVHACLSEFLAAEDRARAGKLGLWAAPGMGALRADDADGLARMSGGFAEVEGILQVHASRGGTLYLTLGRDRWGFAAVLTRRDAARFAKAGLDVEDYAGTPVRLRGDLDDRFGARLRLTDPDQFESLEPGSLDAPSGPAR